MDLTNTRKSKESIHSFALSAGSKVRQVTSEFNPTGEREPFDEFADSTKIPSSFSSRIRAVEDFSGTSPLSIFCTCFIQVALTGL